MLGTYGYYDLPSVVTAHVSIETVSLVYGGLVAVAGLLTWALGPPLVRRLADGIRAFFHR